MFYAPDLHAHECFIDLCPEEICYVLEIAREQMRDSAPNRAVFSNRLAFVMTINRLCPDDLDHEPVTDLCEIIIDQAARQF